MFRKMVFWVVIPLFIAILAACGKKATTVAPTAIPVPPTAKPVQQIATTAPPTFIPVQPTFTPAPTNTLTPTPTKTLTPTPTKTLRPTPSTPTPLPTIPGPVAILVVDDFINEVNLQNGIHPTPTPPESIKNTSDNCVYSSSGQQGFASSGAQGFASSGAQGFASTGAFIPVVDQNGRHIPHGELVFNHIRNDLNGAFGQQDTSISVDSLPTPVPGTELTWVGPIDYWNTPIDQDIFLVPVDTSNYKTTAVRDRIQETIQTLSAAPFNIQRFVLNMSFVIMPCDLGFDGKQEITTTTILQDYINLITTTEVISELGATLTDYATGTYSDETVRNGLLYGPELGPMRILYFYNHIKYKDWISNDTNYARIANDPLKTWLVDLLSDPAYRVISVAAAGNFGHLGYDYPFAPAIWDSVVSVSANGWDPLDPDVQENHGAFILGYLYPFTKTRYSNPGEVMFDGRLNYAILNNDTPPKEMYYFGTSFAAPELSVREAVHLLNGGDIFCFNNQGTVVRSQPPLGYANLYGPWDNLLFNVAVQGCPNFKTMP